MCAMQFQLGRNSLVCFSRSTSLYFVAVANPNLALTQVGTLGEHGDGLSFSNCSGYIKIQFHYYVVLSLAGNGNAATSGSAVNVPLNVGSNAIAVLVTAQDGVTKETYTVTVTRSPLSSNANLSVLTMYPGTLTPAFASGATSYMSSVTNSVNSINMTPTVADSTATVTVNGNAATSGSAVNVSLNVGSNTITVVVTAQDGTTRTYTVTVTRNAAIGGGSGSGRRGGGASICGSIAILMQSCSAPSIVPFRPA